MIDVNWDELFKLMGQILCGVICIGIPAAFIGYPIVMSRMFSGEWPWTSVWREWRESRRNRQ